MPTTLTLFAVDTSRPKVNGTWFRCSSRGSPHKLGEATEGGGGRGDVADECVSGSRAQVSNWPVAWSTPGGGGSSPPSASLVGKSAPCLAIPARARSPPLRRLDNSQGTGFKPDAMQDKKHTAYGK